MRRCRTRPFNAWKPKNYQRQLHAAGGGVAELLSTLIPYARDLGVDVRWLVIGGDPDFFQITKRIHNALHGLGHEPLLGPSDRELLDRVASDNAAQIGAQIRPGDIAVLHDPQTAGLVPHLADRGAIVVWRCHVGTEKVTATVRNAWHSLSHQLAPAHALVFSCARFVWSDLDRERVSIIAPSIDPASPKNQDLTDEEVASILQQTGLTAGTHEHSPRRALLRGTARARLYQEVPVAPERPLVTQISRWDRLKDPAGVLDGFALHAAQRCPADLMLAGPDTEGVTDDPEGPAVFAEIVNRWRNLPDDIRRRVHLAQLPMANARDNALMVNALQRRSQIVVQKSLAEGFGLTVAEAMWKGRPIVASAVGGICEQVDSTSGILLQDPTDPAEFGTAVVAISSNPALAMGMGRAGHHRVQQRFLAVRTMTDYADLITALIET